jgi:hypothetical protein
MQRALLIVSMVAATACAGKSSTAPITGNVSGSWSGPMSSALLGTGTLSLSLVQVGDSVTGTWTTAFPVPGLDLIGTVAGNISGSTITVLLQPLGGSTCQYGPYDLTATVSGTSSLRGSFVTAYNCVLPDSGTYTAAKQ